jgi:hypothetical protein
MLTQSRLKELLHYDPETGLFTWLVSTSNCVKVGDVAGSVSHGYRIIKIDGKKYGAHRLAFLYITGNLPENDTDHINGIRDDNRWCNLREATRAENMQNKAPYKAGTSKYPGVYWHKQRQKWVAQITINGKQKHIGLFETEEEAYSAYCAAKAEHHKFQPQQREALPC